MSLRQFTAYVRKVFHLHRLAGRITDFHCDPGIPTPAVWFSLLFGAVFKSPRFLQLQSETRRKAWQHTVGYPPSVKGRLDPLPLVAKRLRPGPALGWAD